MVKRIYGSQAGLFGEYEWAKLLRIDTLVYMLLAALATWALTYVVPVIEDWGGFWAAAVGIIVPIVRAWLLKQSDNTDKFIRSSG